MKKILRVILIMVLEVLLVIYVAFCKIIKLFNKSLYYDICDLNEKFALWAIAKFHKNSYLMTSWYEKLKEHGYYS